MTEASVSGQVERRLRVVGLQTYGHLVLCNSFIRAADVAVHFGQAKVDVGTIGAKAERLFEVSDRFFVLAFCIE